MFPFFLKLLELDFRVHLLFIAPIQPHQTLRVHSEIQIWLWLHRLTLQIIFAFIYHIGIILTYCICIWRHPNRVNQGCPSESRFRLRPFQSKADMPIEKWWHFKQQVFSVVKVILFFCITINCCSHKHVDFSRVAIRGKMMQILGSGCVRSPLCAHNIQSH